MPLTLRPLTPAQSSPFAAEASGLDLRHAPDEATIAEVERAMDRHAVLVFRGQPLTQDEQVAWSRRFGPLDGGLRKATGAKTRFQHEELIDIGNVALDGNVASKEDPKLVGVLANQLWHSDSSFQDLPVKYSMLSAVVVPDEGGETEWCDLRAAWDDLPTDLRKLVEGRRARHSAFHSRILLGDDKYDATQLGRFPPVERPLVHVHPGSGRKVLFPSVHCERVIGLPVPEGRLLVAELIEFATQPRYVYRHRWQPGDFVMWDNRSTLHRGRRYDLSQRRDLRRTTTLEPSAARAAA